MDTVMNRLIALSAQELDLLEWLGQWTPEVARADWERRRRWPPGFREVADTSVVNAEKDPQIVARMAASPSRQDGRRMPRLVAYRLVEGNPWARALRLTPRGRAALLLAGRAAPERFSTHFPEVFADVDLRPVVEDDLYETGSREGREYRRGDVLPDVPETWRLLLREYREAAQPGRRMQSTPTAYMGVTSSTGTALPGSLRMHHRFIRIEVRDADRRSVCDFSLSLEGLSDLLTGRGEVPVALDYYQGSDGMPRAWLAPEPVSVADRMQARIEATQAERDVQLAELCRAIEEVPGISQKSRQRLLGLVQRAQTRAADTAYRVEQAQEEISAVVETALTMAQERLGSAQDRAGALAALGMGRAVAAEPVASLPAFEGEE